MVDPVDLLDQSLGLGHFGIVLQRDDDAICEGLLVDALISLAAALLFDKAPSGFLPGYEICLPDVVQAPDRGFHGFCGLFVIAVVDEGRDLIFPLQRPDHAGEVVEDGRKAADDHKTRDGDADGGEGHEPVGEHVPHAFLEQIPKLSNSLH